MFFMSEGSTTVAIENTQVVVKKTADFILPVIVSTLILVFVFSSIAVLFLTLRTSHKISGPLFRLTREIDALKDGNFTGRNFSIRGSDQLQNFAASLRDMCNNLNKKHSDIRQKYKALRDYLNSKDYSISEQDKEKFLKILKDIEQELDSFKIS